MRNAEPPTGIPEAIAEKWRSTYLAALTEERRKFKWLADPERDPGDAERHRREAKAQRIAREAANQLLRVPEPKSYDEAMALEPWQFIRREVVGGAVEIVTRHGVKHTLPIPATQQQS